MTITDYFFPESDLLFAREIALKIATHYPANSEIKLKTPGGKKRLSGLIEAVMRDVNNYQSQKNMGWIRKARFGNEIKWQLKEKGYSVEFIDAIVNGVVTHLATLSGEEYIR